MKKLILAVVVGSILAGCASSPESDIAARLDAMEQQQRDLIARQKAEAQEQREKEMAATPRGSLSRQNQIPRDFMVLVI